SGDKQAGHSSDDGLRGRGDGVASNSWKGDWHRDRHDWDDWGRFRHGHHFFFGFGIWSPFFGYGFYDPFWWGGGWGWPYYAWGWPYAGWGGWPGGLSFGYASHHWGFMYGTGIGYGYGWPYYMYDACCMSPSMTYMADSPAYAA